MITNVSIVSASLRNSASRARGERSASLATLSQSISDTAHLLYRLYKRLQLPLERVAEQPQQVLHEHVTQAERRHPPGRDKADLALPVHLDQSVGLDGRPAQRQPGHDVIQLSRLKRP